MYKAKERGKFALHKTFRSWVISEYGKVIFVCKGEYEAKNKFKELTK